MNANIVVAGATGMIGRELCRALAGRGLSIFVLSRGSSDEKGDLGFPATIIGWDEDRALTEVIEDAAAVINLAGENIAGLRWSRAKKARIRQSRIGTTQRLAALIRKVRVAPAVYLSASAVGYYGDRGDELLDESSSPGQGFLAETVLQWEEASLDLPSQVRRVLMRFGVVLSAHDGMLGRLLPLYKLGLGSRMGSGRQWLSWVHIQDLVAAACFILESKQVVGPVNVCSPRPATAAQLHELLASAFSPFTLPPVPSAVLRACMGDAASVILDSTRVTPKRLAEQGFAFRHETLSGALQDLFPSQQAAP